jgi:hypothetical protein
MRFYSYAYWVFITPEILNFTPFGVIYPGSPTPALNGSNYLLNKELFSK